MTVLELRFPAGRFHATPWGRHVNEGAVEWPPAPWRVLRSLIATWYLKARNEVPKETLRALVAALAADAPHYYLPRATNGHTRHYLPVIEGNNEKSTKVFDTFIQLAPSDAILMAWDATLQPDQLAAFKTLSTRLGYLGRAESLVVALVPDHIVSIKANAVPLANGADVPPGSELVRLLAPLSPSQYVAWRADFLAKNALPKTASKSAATKKTSSKSLAAKKPAGLELPADLFAALHADTGELQAAGWNLPPGAAMRNYIRPENAFAPVPRAPRPSSTIKPTVARYVITSAVLPRLIQAVSVANRIHDALCKWSDQGGGPSEVFTGVAETGKSLNGHKHAHIFCEANGSRDAITHVTVWATMGFDEQACLALRRLNKVWGHGGHDLRLVLIGIGQPDSFTECVLFGASKVWRSMTPFVPTRHAKTFRDGRPKIDASNGWQIGSAGHDLLRLLAMNTRTDRAAIRQEKVIRLGGNAGHRTLRCLEFQTVRRDGGGSRGLGEGGSFTLTFPEEVTGPLSFGYGSHFGLGLFAPTIEGNTIKR